jgi:cell wall-associated NlpC family hydrolase
MFSVYPYWRASVAKVATATLTALAPLAQAAPEAPAPAMAAASAPADAVLQLLQERGLLPAQVAGETQQLVSRVRDTASDLVLSAMNFLGVPYRRGGSQPEQGFDCSGFTRHIFERSVGLMLPRRADQQANEAGLLDVKKDELKPGDLVFFNTMRRAFSHVGIYVGEGKFIHSPRSGGQVRVEDMREAYWAKRFNGARRADVEATAPPLNARGPARDANRNATRP